MIQDEVCDRAVSLGVQTILGAREVVRLVSGSNKRRALGAAVRGPIDPGVPASILQSHPRRLVLADRAAADPE